MLLARFADRRFALPPEKRNVGMVFQSYAIWPHMYQVEVEGRGAIVIHGDRHEPIDEDGKVWLKLRPEGHSAWSSDWSHNELENLS